LWSYLGMLCKNGSLADDLLQESYLRFFKAGISGLNEFQMKAYLYKTAISVVKDYWRSEKRDFRRHADVYENEPATDPEISHEIKEILDKLDPHHQSLLWLAYVEGFQHNEIAKMLDVKEKSVRVLLFRARRELTAILKNEGFGLREKR
jgi:RNA polymerase sigma-70 factor (ECF subfamily)